MIERADRLTALSELTAARSVRYSVHIRTHLYICMIYVKYP